MTELQGLTTIRVYGWLPGVLLAPWGCMRFELGMIHRPEIASVATLPQAAQSRLNLVRAHNLSLCIHDRRRVDLCN